MYFFQAGVLFSVKNAKFWPILANFNYLVASLRTFTGLNNVMVCQNLQISGVCRLGRHNSNSKQMNDDNSYPVGSTLRYVMKLCTGFV